MFAQKGRFRMAADDPTGPCGPDYRMLLANERTFLARQGMSLGLLAGSIAVQSVPAPGFSGVWCVLGIVLALLSVATAGTGLLRWRHIDRELRGGPVTIEPMTRPDCRSH